ncbi:MAG TPA: bifunctional phosphopantothenoylcysteine decarboxylase/phosphopantothenate--cysteine ligase CoaBC [Candidatus Limnocylindrales bacterium]|nr:bifunctional phosphopantothenoylcysteine decarboxylase/phosphopantothenate--cysteine ligase CoaBC [Candidatus Limnocylindrales bacterium]
MSLAEASGKRLDGRLIALGVTGSIAAYKAVELLRLLTAEGADVVVLLSPAATRFVGPLTFEALSRHPVESELMELLPDGRIGHVVVADSADAIVVAPATAHWLGAMANGLAGDVVTAACLATVAPVVVAPAMDGEMYAHPATRANVARLRGDFGYSIVEPEAGPLASGQTGVGRLAELPRIVDAVVAAVGDRPVRAPAAAARPPLVEPPRDADLAGRHVVVTAGGTREPIDPVRYIGNRSTGRMGAAVAEGALQRGARVTVVAANVEVALPEGAAVVRIETADELLATLRGLVRDGLDALVMAAAVADFKPTRAAAAKIPRDGAMSLDLEPTADVLATVASLVPAVGDPGRPVLVGFAAETGSLDRAPDKLTRKGVDLLVANDVSEAGSGFGTDTNRVTILSAGGDRDELPLLPKREVADRLLDRVARALDDRDAARQTGAVTQESRA